MTLEAISLLTIVFAKVEPVLLARNLNSYRKILYQIGPYSKKQVVIEVSALGVLLVLILDSTSLDQINSLKKYVSNLNNIIQES